MRKGYKWSGKLGLWTDAEGNVVENNNPAYPSETNEDVISSYFDVLKKCRQEDGSYSFEEHNARTLIWMMGNKYNRKLSNVRNIVSLFSKRTGHKFPTLSSRVKTGGKSEVEHERDAIDLFNKLKLDDLVVETE